MRSRNLALWAWALADVAFVGVQAQVVQAQVFPSSGLFVFAK